MRYGVVCNLFLEIVIKIIIECIGNKKLIMVGSICFISLFKVFR